MNRSLERVPQLGSKLVPLSVRLPAISRPDSDPLSEGLREFYRRGEFCDVTLLCAGQSFLAHRAVLASQSEVFKKGLSEEGMSCNGPRQEIRLEISNPEAVKFLLDFIYHTTDDYTWKDYNPRTQEINKDVLRLAQNFEFPRLTERATHWLSKDLDTGNVVERLGICEDFGLNELREKILHQLTMNKTALAEVANSPQIMQYPGLMQALLQQAAHTSDADELARGGKRPAIEDSEQPKKKKGKGKGKGK